MPSMLYHGAWSPSPRPRAASRRCAGSPVGSPPRLARARLGGRLPADLDAGICIVLHIPPTGRSVLAPILDREGPLHAVPAEHGARLRRGTIYVARPDHHL